MAKQSLHDGYLAKLKANGFVEIPSAAARYTVLHGKVTIPSGASREVWIWLGANGAFRYNYAKRQDGSIKAGPRAKALFLGE